MSAEPALQRVRLLTWFALATGALGAVLVALPSLLYVGGPWAQLVLGIVTLILAFRARRVGIAEVEDYDGRLSLLAAILGFIVVFFAGQVAFGILISLAN